MSSRGSHLGGPERDPHYRSRDYHHQRRYGSQADYDAYDEAEPELAPAFDDLDLDDRAREFERPHADASQSISIDSPIHRPLQEDLSPPQHPQTTEANPDFDPDNSLGLVSADSWNASPPRDVGLNREHGSPPTSDSEDFEDPLTYSSWRHLRASGQRDPSVFAQIPGNAPRGGDPLTYSPWTHLRASGQRYSSVFAHIPGNAPRGYPGYPNGGLFVQGAEAALECHCRTCVEHRCDIRRWALPLQYQGRSVPDYIRSAYPSFSSQRGYYWPPRTDWFYPDEDRFSDSDSESSSYGSWVEDVYADHRPTLSNSPRPNPHSAEWENSYYESYHGTDLFEGDYENVGSDHEYSDNASYTGYERYDGYGSGYYDDDDYDDGFYD